MNGRIVGSTFLVICLLLSAASSRLAASDSTKAEKLCRNAEKLVFKGQADQAIADYRAAIKLQPGEARCHAGLAMALDQKHDLHSALNEYRLAIQLDSKNRAFYLMYEGLARELGTPSSGGGEVYSVGGDVTEPIPIYRPNPGYTDEARKAKLRGTVALKITVGSNGEVSSARVAKPLGLGLDEKAVEAVSTWRFKPATRNGEPVPVSLLVEVTFTIR